MTITHEIERRVAGVEHGFPFEQDALAAELGCRWPELLENVRTFRYRAAVATAPAREAAQWTDADRAALAREERESAPAPSPAPSPRRRIDNDSEDGQSYLADL